MTLYTIQNLQHTRPDQRVPAPTLCETNSTQLTFSLLGISRSYFKFYCFDIFKLFTFQGSPNSGRGKRHMGPCLGSIRVDTLVECFLLATTAAQLGSSVPVHCHLESSVCQTTIFLIVHG